MRVTPSASVTDRSVSSSPSAHEAKAVSPIAAKLSEYEQKGWAVCTGRRWHFTPEGFLLSNRLIGELLELQEVETLEGTLEMIRVGKLPRQDANQ